MENLAITYNNNGIFTYARNGKSIYKIDINAETVNDQTVNELPRTIAKYCKNNAIKCFDGNIWNMNKYAVYNFIVYINNLTYEKSATFDWSRVRLAVKYAEIGLSVNLLYRADVYHFCLDHYEERKAKFETNKNNYDWSACHEIRTDDYWDNFPTAEENAERTKRISKNLLTNR